MSRSSCAASVNKKFSLILNIGKIGNTLLYTFCILHFLQRYWKRYNKYIKTNKQVRQVPKHKTRSVQKKIIYSRWYQNSFNYCHLFWFVTTFGQFPLNSMIFRQCIKSNLSNSFLMIEVSCFFIWVSISV